MIIKLLLVACVLGAGWWLLAGEQRGRQLAVKRLLTIALSGAAAVAIAVPESVTKLANAIGVGRGTDLVLYVLVVVFAFSTIASRVHTRRLEDRIARLTRAVALIERDRDQPSAPTR